VKIANSREHAYKASGRLNMVQLRAISRIRNVAGYFSPFAEGRQLRAVINLESELRSIMPSEQSRFHKLREKINCLIQKAYEHEKLF